ncbi:cytochrome P450 monooxygenase CYP63 [Exidia glandulosa HHB12029]|uniref:Cytochrome P450 monooxygenase CYP63 n=1 Tax=Exidia glandulosa HHB12029 TaxID=1314781 RepID=A0A165GLB5_EXIGL|nr:cytochrome P450 monooxygenase CYP63 [Exidia glandulosa HHB12029]
MAILDIFRPSLRNYRGLLLLQCARLFGVPLVAAHIGLSSLGRSTALSSLARVVIYTASVPLFAAGRGLLDDWRQRRAARSMGAVLVPRVEGKWPGNIDVMLFILAEFETGYVLQSFKTLLDQYGVKTLNLRLLWSDLIITMDSGHIKYMLTDGFSSWIKGEQFIRAYESFLGGGIFNRDGHVWKEQRALARPFFARDRVRDFQIFERHATAMLAALRNAPLPPGAKSPLVRAVDMQDLVGRFTMDSAVEFLFGAELNTLGKPLPVAGKAQIGKKGSKSDDEFGSFVQAFEAAQLRAVERVNERWMWPLKELFGDHSRIATEAIDAFVQPIIEAAIAEDRERRDRDETLDMETATMLQYFVSVTSDKKMIRDQLISYMMAGRDTTGSLLTFTMYLLALHPHVFRTVQEEIRSACPVDSIPSFETIRSMPYLRAVLNESLRLFAPVPIDQRGTTAAGSVLPPTNPGDRPLYVPPHTDMYYLLLHLQRDPDTWGSTSLEFDPDRWINEEKLKPFLANPMIFLPFNAGPRICLGQQLAYNQASFFLVRLLQNVSSLELSPEFIPAGAEVPQNWKTQPGRVGLEQVWPKTAVIIYVKGGLWVRMRLNDEV